MRLGGGSCAKLALWAGTREALCVLLGYSTHKEY